MILNLSKRLHVFLQLRFSVIERSRQTTDYEVSNNLDKIVFDNNNEERKL